MVQRMMAWAVKVHGNSPDHIQDNDVDALGMRREHLVDLRRGDGRNLPGGENRAVIVSDERDIHYRDRLFEGKIRLRILGHTDHFPALGGKPDALRPGGKARAIYSHNRPRLMNGYTVLPDHLCRKPPQMRTIGIGRADMVTFWTLVKPI